jgi:thymidylate kinase
MQIVLVSGAAGAGKTAFADRVSQHLTGEGWTVTALRRPADEGTPAGARDPAAARFRQRQAVVGYLEAEPGWVPTAERFRDPPSGMIVRVWIDPSDESRHYVPDDAPTPW